MVTCRVYTINTEPCADRGPQRGSPAGVVDAPDAAINFGDNDKQNGDSRKLLGSLEEVIGEFIQLTLASGATALGSVKNGAR